MSVQRQPEHVGSKVDPQTKEDFERAVLRLQANGELPTNVTKSDVLRGLIREWTDDPDPEIVDSE